MKPDPELEQLRHTIDDLDRQILDLVADRVRIVLTVGDYKRRHGLMAYDPDRERQVLERLCGVAPQPLDRETVRRIFERLIDESRRLEQRHMSRR